MRARILKTCTLVCGSGSEVEITQDQFLALGDAAQPLEGKKPKTKKPKTPKKPVSNLDTGTKE